MDFTRAFCSPKLLIGALIFPICDVFSIWAEAWYELNVFEAMDWSSSGNLAMFTPAVVGIAYAHSYCEDLKNHFLRYHLYRSRLKNYVMSKVVCCAISSGTMLLLGRTISMVLFSMRYSWIAEEIGQNPGLIEKLTSDGQFLLAILIVLCPMFLKGAFYGVMVFMVSTWMPNVFVASVLPIALETTIVNFAAVFPNLPRYIMPNIIFNWEYGVFTSIMTNIVYSICFVCISMYGMFRVSYHEIKRRFENG